MPQVEAGACEKPVISINAMGMLDTIVQGKTGLLAEVAQRVVRNQVVLGPESGYKKKHTVIFDPPRTVDYRASIPSIATYLEDLMNNPQKRKATGQAARKHVVEKFDYRQVARQFVQIIMEKFEIS